MAGTERGDLLVVENGDLRLALPFEGAPAIDAIQATPKATCASCIQFAGVDQTDSCHISLSGGKKNEFVAAQQS